MSAAVARAPGHIPSLDGLRGVSFLVVFAAHAGLDGSVPGGFGVTIFFFLSGYLITTLLRAEQEEHGTVSLRRFYMRRVLRIFPPFYLVLAAAAVAARMGWLPGGVGVRPLAAQALHFANYWIVLFGHDGQPAGTGVYWSLAVEEHYYLVFPLLYLAMARVVRDRRSQAMILWGLCGAMLAWRVILVVGLHASADRTYLATDARADSILFGCALALFDNPALADEPVLDTERRRLPWFLGGAALLLFTFVWRSPTFRETARYTLQGVALIPLFLVALRHPAWGPMRLLNLRPMMWLGDLSYPLYLCHHVVLEAIGVAPSLWRAAAALLASIGVAWIVHELVERPCARLRRRLERAPTTAPPAFGREPLAAERAT
jgi:peptidoglycan/LPS O-acetylase OafA/YrhL